MTPYYARPGHWPRSRDHSVGAAVTAVADRTDPAWAAAVTPLRCYCGHESCHAFASWTPLQPLNVTDISKPKKGSAWLCRRHVTVATKRADAYVAREADRRERAEARRIERAPKLRARLATVEARIRQLDPPSRDDGAVINMPLARRMPTDNQIAELAQLVHERDRLRAEVGA